jgi:ribonuclease Z
VTAQVLQWVQQGKLWLFDCGEGTQYQFLRAPVSLSKLQRIFVTHLHGDHVFGLPGLMASRSAAQTSVSEVEIYGPEDLEQFLKTSLSLTHTRIKYPWQFHAVQEGRVYEDEFCTVDCRLLYHNIPSYGYSIVERDQPGEFIVDKAKSYGIEPGPSYSILKAGGQIELPNGCVIRGADLVGPARRGRKVVICGDTGLSDAVIDLAMDADVLVHEATFMQGQTARAIEVGHSTTVQAAETAKKAGVRKLVLTHISPRYELEDGQVMIDLLKEARDIFPETVLAHDYMAVDIPRRNPENSSGEI